MKIEIWSDYVCPFCYIGKRELERALKETGLEDKVEVSMKAYELDPSASSTENPPVKETLMKNKGLAEDEVENMLMSVTQRAKEVGLDYDFSKMTNANTKKAHQVAKFAEAQGKGAEVSEALLQAHFLENHSLNEETVLLDVAEQQGLDRKQVAEALTQQTYLGPVNLDIQEARELGIRGVPFFVIERQYAISGAQPQDLFQKTLKDVAKELGVTPSLKIMNSEQSGLCADDQCAF